MTPVAGVMNLESIKEKLETLRLNAAADEAPDLCPRCQGTKWMQTERGVVRCPDCVFGIEDPTADVPYEFKNCLLANYESLNGNQPAIKVAKHWLGEKSGDLYFHGGVGSGKTRLAASLLNEFFIVHRRGCFMRVSGLLFNMQPGRSEDARDTLWHRVTREPLLVLDDVGAERDDATDYTRRTLLQLYEERGDRLLRTIWTSNLAPQKLTEQLDDERLVSRIVGRSTVVELKVPDQRLRRRK